MLGCMVDKFGVVETPPSTHVGSGCVEDFTRNTNLIYDMHNGSGAEDSHNVFWGSIVQLH